MYHVLRFFSSQVINMSRTFLGENGSDLATLCPQERQACVQQPVPDLCSTSHPEVALSRAWARNRPLSLEILLLSQLQNLWLCQLNLAEELARVAGLRRGEQISHGKVGDQGDRFAIGGPFMSQ